ncbi:hypothetical protein C8034_v003582 [Colletotrichum sidae]|uniref:DUF7029 domain-containing protein n=1 Tax=Colletotrichum sidae TaxID=1347389 RepID=A0A4R8TRK3_9PEZI|nr:hypothetical protein C8034_v003582 [Colletotrichum sidae]
MKFCSALPLLGFSITHVLAHPGQPGVLERRQNATESVEPTDVPIETVVVTVSSDPVVSTEAPDESTSATSTATSSTSAVATATLLPAVPDDCDLEAITNLTPHPRGSGDAIHYIQDDGPETERIFAIATPKWTAPSVVLDHTALVSHVEVSKDGNLVIKFRDSSAYSHCKSEWTDDGTIFVTYTPDCGDYDLGQRCYYKSHRVSFNSSSMSATAFGQPKAMEDLTDNITVAWGSYGSQQINHTGPATSQTDADATITSPITSTGSTRCVAPQDDKYGLPTACHGPYFDDDLDLGLGLNSPDAFAFKDMLDSVYEANNDVVFDPAEVGVITKRAAAFDPETAATLKSFTEKAKTGIAMIANKSQSAVTNGVAGPTPNDTVLAAISLGGLGTTIGNVIAGRPNVFERDYGRMRLPATPAECAASRINAAERQRLASACSPVSADVKAVKTPWGESALLLASVGGTTATNAQRPSGNFVKIYCVRCGVEGSLRTKGSITFSITQGITQGYIESDIDLDIGVGLGIYAQASGGVPIPLVSRNLFTVPLSPFTAGFVTIGPFLSLGTLVKITPNIVGTAMARVDTSIVRAKFVYDWKQGVTKAAGFKPSFKPSFQSEGELSLAGVQLGIPVALEFGITVGSGCDRCKGTIALRTTPLIKLGAVSGNAPGVKLATCDQTTASISVGNNVDVKLNGFGIPSLLTSLPKTIYKTPDYVLKSFCARRTNKINFRRRDTTDALSLPGTSTEAPLPTSVDVAGPAATYVEEDVEYAEYNGTSATAVPYNIDAESFDGYWFSTLHLQNDNNFVLASCSDGNVYVQQKKAFAELPYYISCNTLWAGFNNSVVSGPTGKVLHYYNNTMERLGVSRLRTAVRSEIPGGSVYLALTPYNHDNNDATARILAAIDPDEHIFFPAVCTYKDGQSPKVYLVGADFEAGLATLKSPDLAYTVTNGLVDDCRLLFLDITERDDDFEAAQAAAIL